MAIKYQNLTKPLKVRNTLLKTRFAYPTAQPHFLQGPESYPADPVVSFYCSLAKNGAAFLLFHDLANDYQRTMGGWDTGHFAMYDRYDKGAQNYFSHFCHMVHFYGGKLCTSLMLDLDTNYTVNENEPQRGPGGPGPMSFSGTDLTESGLEFAFGSLIGPEGQEPNMKGIGMQATKTKFFDKEAMDEYIDAVIERCAFYKNMGFDAAMIPTEYCIQFYNPATNHRNDEFGGSEENRLRFSHYFFGRLRKALGDDFIFYCGAPVGGGPFGGGMSMEDAAKWLIAMEPYIDILNIRSAMGDGLMEDECDCCPGADKAAELKALGVTTPIAVSTPYMDLDKLDDVIGSGKADIILSCHMFLANENLGEILKEGRGEDLNPCILCHACRGVSWQGEWMSHCTINPEMGMEYRVGKMIEPVKKLKKVAIIGGGPGGIKAALWLKERGHTPVIYEKSDCLGGQIKLTRDCDFKWRLTRYWKFLLNQVEKNGIAVRLNTEATPEMIEAEGYDVVIAATGATAKAPKIEGAESAKWNAIDVFGHEAQLGKKVVVVGGASTAAEAAIYLARSGHEVVEVCRKNIVAYELNPIRERGNVNELSVKSGVKHYRCATTNKIEPGKVYITDKDGNEVVLECDDVVVSGGMEPNRDSAIAFHGCAPEFYTIGDCHAAGNMRNAIYDAYSVAMRI